MTLLTNGGRLVPVDSLMNELWGEDIPRRAENALQAHVSRLRRKLEALEPERRVPRLSTWPSGYQLSFDDDELDAGVFLRTLGEAEYSAHPDPVRATMLLRDALAMWRGAAFGGPVGGPICQAAAARYEESRFAALELLFDYELKVGRHVEVIAELRQLFESELLNERLCEQLMVALYRSGRQTDALSVYQQMRLRLTEELGIEPSPTLRRVERAILAHDPNLAARADHVALRT